MPRVHGTATMTQLSWLTETPRARSTATAARHKEAAHLNHTSLHAVGQANALAAFLNDSSTPLTRFSRT